MVDGTDVWRRRLLKLSSPSASPLLSCARPQRGLAMALTPAAARDLRILLPSGLRGLPSPSPISSGAGRFVPLFVRFLGISSAFAFATRFASQTERAGFFVFADAFQLAFHGLRRARNFARTTNFSRAGRRATAARPFFGDCLYPRYSAAIRRNKPSLARRLNSIVDSVSIPLFYLGRVGEGTGGERTGSASLSTVTSASALRCDMAFPRDLNHATHLLHFCAQTPLPARASAGGVSHRGRLLLPLRIRGFGCRLSLACLLRRGRCRATLSRTFLPSSVYHSPTTAMWAAAAANVRSSYLANRRRCFSRENGTHGVTGHGGGLGVLPWPTIPFTAIRAATRAGRMALACLLTVLAVFFLPLCDCICARRGRRDDL